MKLPIEALCAWAEEAAGPGDPVDAVEPLAGGMSTTMLALTTRRGRRFVLRVYDNAPWLSEEPDLPRHEAWALETAARLPIPTPQLIACEESGTRCGMPLLLMSRLPGKVELPEQPGDGWLGPMAETLARLHGGAAGAEAAPWTYRTYQNVRSLGELSWAWTSRQDAWRRVRALVAGPLPSSPVVFIHRDYHPTNLLWSGGRLSGVVDWINACRGPAGIDVGHCRLNLALMYGPAAADRFLEAYLCYAGAAFAYEPYWDLLALIEFLPGPPEVYPGWPACGLAGLTPELMTERYEAYMESLLRRVEK